MILLFYIVIIINITFYNSDTFGKGAVVRHMLFKWDKYCQCVMLYLKLTDVSLISQRLQ